ncbi:hypothetical protein SDC9_71840 [bioreactor metagenome]|uniref:Uncharacterized protein n=1 Tax=bioreactor metagenome TaxID=1076179 RepID=A0A644YAK6_9ZZZZ
MSVNVNSTEQFDLLSEREQIQLVEWCKNLEKADKFNKNYTSYGLKHIFQYNGGFYVTNGAFKQAMLLAGFSHKECSSTINWWFNVSRKSIKASLIRKRA